MKTASPSPASPAAESPAALRDRLADLTAQYQRLIVHGDIVSRADKQAEIDAIHAQLRGAAFSPARAEDDAFFGRTAVKLSAPAKTPAVVVGSKTAELREIVEEAKAKGLVTMPGVARPVAKDGQDALAARGGVRSQWIEVKPAKARQWLENNFRNRPLSDDVVAAYARDMAVGVWVATHQGIAFNDRDELIDGQHRLHAIVRSGVTVRMMVTFGLASEIAGREMTTMDAVDRGRTRSVSDQLRIQHGMQDGAAIAAICATLGSVCYGERTRRLSVGQTLEIYRAFEEPVTWVIAHRSKERGMKTTGVLAGFAFALAGMVMQEERARIEGLWAALHSGRCGDGTGIGQLRALLTSDAAVLLTRGTDRAMIEVVLEAIRLELTGSSELLQQVATGADYFRARQRDRVEKIATLFRLPA